MSARACTGGTTVCSRGTRPERCVVDGGPSVGQPTTSSTPKRVDKKKRTDRTVFCRASLFFQVSLVLYNNKRACASCGFLTVAPRKKGPAVDANMQVEIPGSFSRPSLGKR